MPKELEVSFDDDPPLSAPEESFENATPVRPQHPAQRVRPETDERPRAAVVPFSSASAAVGRVLPHSLDAEELLISTVLIDPDDVLRQADEVHMAPDWFYDPKHGVVWQRFLKMRAAKIPIDVISLREEMMKAREMGTGMPIDMGFLLQISSKAPTTAQAPYFIQKVREFHALRLSIRAHTRAVEDAYNYTGDIDEFLSRQAAEIGAIANTAILKSHASAKSLLDFELVPSNDQSVVIGRRYLNRGDIGILVSSSGMGKSSMSIQMAVLWALGRPAFDIPCNGPQRSLIIQSEDSEGDIAEVKDSVIHRLELTAADLAQVGRNVIVVTDRVNRGPRFFASLRRLIAKFKPDIVWINPLQAFLDGDIKESKDLGTFVREGLNGLNEPASHIYMLVHHTNKIGGGSVKDKAAPNWFDMMYAMAGGAELINAARAIMILEPQKAQGDFVLNLAKRGTRAGVRRLVGESKNTWETVTAIPLQHAKGKIDGADGKMPLIFWEPRVDTKDPDAPATAAAAASPGSGRPEKYAFNDIREVFPPADGPGLDVAQLHRKLVGTMPTLTTKILYGVLPRWIQEGHAEVIITPGESRRYRAKPPVQSQFLE
jgi:hypothetical protein